MRELNGTPRIPGVAMAVAVVVDVQGGLSGVPESVMRQGLRSLKMGLKPEDYPEVVIVCDLLAIGSSVRIPGIRTIGIAAQGDDEPAIPLSVPCVAGINGLMQSMDDTEQIVIVDGDAGVVYIEPDVQTVIRYQSSLSPQPAERVFLESDHLPAKTRDGRLVTVSAVASSIKDAEVAISQGADSLVVMFSEFIKNEIASNHNYIHDPELEIFETLLILAAGKPIIVVAENPDVRLVALAERFAMSEHIEFVDMNVELEALSEAGVRDAVCNKQADTVTVTSGDVTQTKDLIRNLPDEDDMYASFSHPKPRVD